MQTVLANVLNVVYMLLILGVLVLVHELGHLYAARRIGVPVISFSIGMGPVLYRWKTKSFGDTEFRLSLVPFGGYVIVSGEGEDAEDPNSLYTKSPWKRMWFAASGVTMNFLLALVLFFVIAFAWGEPVAFINKIGGVTGNEPAQKAGMQAGDWILYVNNEPCLDWSGVVEKISANPEKEISVVYGREQGQKTVEVTYQSEVSIFGKDKETLSSFKFPAEKPDNEVLISIDGQYFRLNSLSAINGNAVGNWEDVIKNIGLTSSLKSLTYDVSLETFDVKMTPYPKTEKIGDKEVIVGKIGIMVGQPKMKRIGFFDSIWIALQQFWYFIAALFAFFVRLFQGQIGGGDVAGPVKLVDYTGQAARMGWMSILSFTAMLSMNLGFINMVPFPGLDGARFFFSLFEGITGKKLSRKVENIVHGVGFFILIGIMILIFSSEIIGLFR